MNLPFVIVAAARQKEAVNRLVEHCRTLDGTRLKVIRAKDVEGAFPNNTAFLQAARAMRGKPWGWLEPDSIPRFPGWARALTEEYRRGGKPFMLSSDFDLPFDRIGGIGCYPGNSDQLIPMLPDGVGGFDGWLLDHLPHAIHRTPLIQHRYAAEYSPDSVVTRHNEFPRDSAILRPDAIIFHADKLQTLIDPAYKLQIKTPEPEIAARPHPKERTLTHHGDCGDLIAALPALRQLGGGHVVLSEFKSDLPGLVARESLRGARYEALKPLLEIQPYVQSVSWSDKPTVTEYDVTRFRAKLRRGEDLATAQARHLGIEDFNLNLSPWITVPNVTTHKRVICFRSPRYHNETIWGPIWKEIGRAYGDQLLFLGLPSELAPLEAATGRKIEYAPTPTFLDAARLIAGAPLVIGNQTSLAWISYSVGARILLEVDPTRANSIIRNNPRSVFCGGPNDAQEVLRALRRL